MQVGHILKDLRTSKKLTQVNVCSKVKISQTFLSQVESDKKQPSASMLKILCVLYGVPVQVVVWKSLTEKDIPKNKRKAFALLSPAVNELISEFF